MNEPTWSEPDRGAAPKLREQHARVAGANAPGAPHGDEARKVIVVFFLDEQRYALPLRTVERVLRAVEVTPLPKAPEIVLGAINMQGRILPVVNLRRRFHLPEREIRLSDQLIIARTAKRDVTLVADSVAGVAELSAQDVIAPEAICPGLQYMAGVARLTDGMVLIHDLDRFLSLEEERKLAAALQRA